MKAKVFSVKLTAYMEFAVLAETQEDAEDRARVAVSCGDFQIDDTSASEASNPEEINSLLRHADDVDYDLEEARKFAKSKPFAEVPAELLEMGD